MLPTHEPMLAVPWPEPFSDHEWTFELKWDGVRALLSYDGSGPGTLLLRSRRGNDVTARYPELHRFRSSRPCVLDGEIVTLDDSGVPSFERLQSRMNLGSAAQIARAAAQVPVTYVVFDVLHLGGDCTNLPIEARREVLAGIELSGPMVRSDVVEDDSSALWDFVRDRGIEGMVAKRKTSVYRPGIRSSDWRKVTHFATIRAAVGGYTKGDRARASSFGSLLLGLWTDEGLRWIGSVGSGFDERALVAIRSALDEMTVPTSPFLPDPGLPSGAVWVDPRLVAVVQHKHWTAAGRLRAPSFKGFSDDPVETVTWAAEVGLES